MAIEIKVPDIGADEVEVTEILVNVGDTIEEDQSLLTVEGDKASMEVPASQGGVVKAILVNVGDSVATGSVIMEFEAAAEAAPAEAPAAAAPAPVAAPTPATGTGPSVQPVAVPDIGADEVEVTEVMVAVGDTIEEEQALITVEGDKASMEVPAPFAGTVTAINVKAGDSVSTGSLIMEFEVAGVATAQVTGAPAAAAAPAPAEVAPVTAPERRKPAPSAPADSVEVASIETSTGFIENSAYAYATPVVRRLARELGVDLSRIKGTGRKNRILQEDVHHYVKAALAQLQSGAVAPAGKQGSGLDLIPWPKVDFSKFGEVEVKPLSRIKKLSGANLARNWAMIPHVTQFDEADITELEAFRKDQNAVVAKQELGFKITPLVFILKAVAKTLADLPQFNASLSEDGESIVLKKYISIGVAVDTPNGLVVPVVRDVDKKGIYELSEELLAISKKARAGKLTAADMQGGNFTISSLGGIGGTSFTPIVNAPDVAILGVSKSEMKPKWNGKEFVPRLSLPLSLSYDHRVIDGADGARFTTVLAGYLSDIRKLVL